MNGPAKRTVDPVRALALAHDVLATEARAIEALAARLGAPFVAAVTLLLECEGRVVVCGIGKSGHVARKLAATLASTGTPAFFVHPAEASHGDLGMITPDDVVVMLSNSGETDELTLLTPHLKRHGARIVAITGNEQSSLAQAANVHLDAAVDEEAGPLKLAPTASTTAALALGDALALALLVYGYLRGTGFVRVAALAGATVVATLPLVNVHVALAGYADLPMAAYYCAAALATLRWTQSRSRFDAGLALVLAAACPFIKTPGIVWLLTLAAPLSVALLPRHGKRVAVASGVAAVMVLLVLAQTSPTILNYHLHLDFAPPWEALFDSLFMFSSWNLLWYGAVGAALLCWRQLLSRDLAPYTLLIAAGLLFLFIVFAFTNARAWVETQTTVNRAVLHLAPLLTVWMMVVFHRRFDATCADDTAALVATAAVNRPDAAATLAFATPPASDAAA